MVMVSIRSVALFSISSYIAIHVKAQEVHTIALVNNCGFGTPTLVGQGGQILSTGGAYTSYGPIRGAIAYLQTGGCGLNGDYCTTVEATLDNVGSSADITLIPDHYFSVTSGFGYYNGCDGAGADCTYNGCGTAFYEPDQTWVQVGCSAANVDLAITFCD